LASAIALLRLGTRPSTPTSPLRRRFGPARLALAGLVLLCGGGMACSESPAPAADDEAAFEQARDLAFRLHDAADDPAEALTALLAAYELRPDVYGVNHRLGLVYADLKRNEKALEHFQKAHAAKPDEVDDRLAIVRLLLANGEHEAALPWITPLLDVPGARGEALFHQARVLDLLDRRDEALQCLVEADGLPVEEAYHALSLHGRYLAEAGDFAAAEALFLRALSGRPDYKEALRGLADTCRRQGRTEEAAHWDRLLALFLDLTDNVFIRKQPAKRREILEHLTAEYPQWTPGFQQLALLLRREGQDAEACHVIERFLEVHGAKVSEQDAAALRQKFCGAER